MKNLRNYGATLILLAGLVSGTISIGAEIKRGISQSALMTSDDVTHLIPGMVANYKQVSDEKARNLLFGITHRAARDISRLGGGKSTAQHLLEWAHTKAELSEPAVAFLTTLKQIYDPFKDNINLIRSNLKLQEQYRLVGQLLREDLINQMREVLQFQSAQ